MTNSMPWPSLFGSGDVNQQNATSWFSPHVTFSYAGNPAVEERAVRDVASFGKQIGWLSDIALALIEDEAPPADAVEKLKKASAKIAQIKKEVEEGASAAAHNALERLKNQSRDAYESLIKAEASALGYTPPKP